MRLSHFGCAFRGRWCPPGARTSPLTPAQILPPRPLARLQLMLKDDNIDHKIVPVSGYESVMREYAKETEAEGGAPAVRLCAQPPPSLPPPRTALRPSLLPTPATQS